MFMEVMKSFMIFLFLYFYMIIAYGLAFFILLQIEDEKKVIPNEEAVEIYFNNSLLNKAVVP